MVVGSEDNAGGGAPEPAGLVCRLVEFSTTGAVFFSVIHPEYWRGIQSS